MIIRLKQSWLDHLARRPELVAGLQVRLVKGQPQIKLNTARSPKTHEWMLRLPAYRLEVGTT